jgi:molybdopterin synthase catalytic subunit
MTFDAQISIDISQDKIDVGTLTEQLQDDQSGAITSFIGTTRNNFHGRQVVTLSYSCYATMARKELKHIIKEAIQHATSTSRPSSVFEEDVLSTPQNRPSSQSLGRIFKVAVVHRVGEVPVGEKSVFIGVSSQHRKEGIAAMEYILEHLKKRVPIWKQEVYADGDSCWKDNWLCC